MTGIGGEETHDGENVDPSSGSVIMHGQRTQYRQSACTDRFDSILYEHAA